MEWRWNSPPRGGRPATRLWSRGGMGMVRSAQATSKVNEKVRRWRVEGTRVQSGETGSHSTVPLGRCAQRQASAPWRQKHDAPELSAAHGLAEPFRKLAWWRKRRHSARCNQARAFGAEGIGLAAPAHVFGEKSCLTCAAMILANTEKDRPLPAAHQKTASTAECDFAGVFRAMDGFPVTIRNLDPHRCTNPASREDHEVEDLRF